MPNKTKFPKDGKNYSFDDVDIQPIKINHTFEVHTVKDNAPPDQYDGMQIFGVKGRQTQYERDMIPFIISSAKKESDEALDRGKKALGRFQPST